NVVILQTGHELELRPQKLERSAQLWKRIAIDLKPVFDDHPLHVECGDLLRRVRIYRVIEHQNRNARPPSGGEVEEIFARQRENRIARWDVRVRERHQLLE